MLAASWDIYLHHAKAKQEVSGSAQLSFSIYTRGCRHQPCLTGCCVSGAPVAMAAEATVPLGFNGCYECICVCEHRVYLHLTFPKLNLLFYHGGKRTVMLFLKFQLCLYLLTTLKWQDFYPCSPCCPSKTKRRGKMDRKKIWKRETQKSWRERRTTKAKKHYRTSVGRQTVKGNNKKSFSLNFFFVKLILYHPY